jgi:hypothetical protein
MAVTAAGTYDHRRAGVFGFRRVEYSDRRHGNVAEAEDALAGGLVAVRPRHVALLADVAFLASSAFRPERNLSGSVRARHAGRAMSAVMSATMQEVKGLFML